MTTSILDDVNRALTFLERVKEDLEANETIGLNADLLRTLLILDERYKEFTLSWDEDDDEDPGTVYNSKYGVNVEFYIEASDWHDISKALRVWKDNNPGWPEMLSIDTEDMIDI